MNDVNNGYLVSKTHAYYVFTLLFLLYMFNYVDRLVVVSIFPFLHDEWGVSDTQCGLLVSAAYWSILRVHSITMETWSA
ncbi:MAG: hypothetical protein U9P80_02495 [Thermodesulfobacteriota bacterium]|nr:hypothetical protein [Thermodesulfobacteriota bacterium]